MSKTTNKFSAEVRKRAVRMVLDSEAERRSRWAAIAPKIGSAAQTLNQWCKRAEIERGRRADVTTEMAERLKALEREGGELRQANVILLKASASFAQAELNRRSK